MNGLHRPVLRFHQTRRACTGQSPPTFCPGADINAHNAPACSYCLWRPLLSHSHISPKQLNPLSGDSPREDLCATQTEDFGQLVASTSTAARSAARESSPATGTIAITTRFLRTRFVDHERTTFDVQSVEFANGLCRIIFRPEFNKSETFRSASVPIHDDAGRDRRIALRGKQLQQALIGNAVRQTSYVKLCHMLSSVLIGSNARGARTTNWVSENSSSMLCCLCA